MSQNGLASPEAFFTPRAMLEARRALGAIAFDGANFVQQFQEVGWPDDLIPLTIIFSMDDDPLFKTGKLSDYYPLSRFHRKRPEPVDREVLERRGDGVLEIMVSGWGEEEISLGLERGLLAMNDPELQENRVFTIGLVAVPTAMSIISWGLELPPALTAGSLAAAIVTAAVRSFGALDKAGELSEQTAQVVASRPITVEPKI